MNNTAFLFFREKDMRYNDGKNMKGDEMRDIKRFEIEKLSDSDKAQMRAAMRRCIKLLREKGVIRDDDLDPELRDAPVPPLEELC